jgi:hypothetical protein|tara:strand:+ start:101 stop:547 length:447 start_codon:yes stop_codon:yes gene_type:complete
MAFKAIDRNEVVEVVSADDPAIDLDNSDLDAYKDSHDIKHLNYKKDEQPSVFHIGTISFMKFSEIKDRHISFDLGGNGQEIKTNLFGLTADALRYSLKKADNLPFKIRIERNRVSDTTMDKLARLNIVEELGNMALNINGFGDDDKKK